MRLIDADELKKAIYKRSYYIDDYEEAIKIIDNAPTVKDRFSEGYAQGYVDGHTSASSVSATWIYKDYDYVCSNCNSAALDRGDYPECSKFCPHCGAEMEI